MNDTQKVVFGVSMPLVGTIISRIFNGIADRIKFRREQREENSEASTCATCLKQHTRELCGHPCEEFDKVK